VRAPTVWVWAATNVLVTVAVAAVTLGDVGSPVRPLVVLCFLLVCPGMAIVRLFAIDEFLTRLTLAVATSIALATVASATTVYAGRSSIGLALTGLVSVTLGGTLVEIVGSALAPADRARLLGVGPAEPRRDATGIDQQIAALVQDIEADLGETTT
jgi:hypothetical protein